MFERATAVGDCQPNPTSVISQQRLNPTSELVLELCTRYASLSSPMESESQGEWTFVMLWRGR